MDTLTSTERKTTRLMENAEVYATTRALKNGAGNTEHFVQQT